MGGRRIGLVLAVFGQPGIEAGLHGVLRADVRRAPSIYQAALGWAKCMGDYNGTKGW
jgi:hypothetical protein